MMRRRERHLLAWTSLSKKGPKEMLSREQTGNDETGRVSPSETGAVAYSFLDVETSARAILAWPVAKTKNIAMDECLQRFSRIIYRHEIWLSFDDLVELVKAVYKHEPWIGGSLNDFQGAKNKSLWCRSDGSALTLFIIEPHIGVDLVHEKRVIRDRFELEKNSIHISDSYLETSEISAFLLNFRL